MIDFNTAGHRVLTSGNDLAENVELIRIQKGNTFSFKLKNNGTSPVLLKEAVVFEDAMPYPASTRFYGEGFNMLSQYYGTLEHFESGSYTDKFHYKLPQKEGFFTCYNVLFLAPEGGELFLAGFTSCHRFTNEIRFNPDRFEFVIDCDGQELAPGETLELEDFFFGTGMLREKLFSDFAAEIEKHHTRMPYSDKITGWCSWYSYGPDITEKDILDNMKAMREKLPSLRFVQIDDGYQDRMGDWLVPHKNFPNGVKELCLKIKENGFEPAIWVSPFIAEPESRLFRDHPDWFLTDDDSKPVPSSSKSFGGWRAAPWYMLDGSNPEALEYLRLVFRTMREEWQCKYFKLDGTMWGCMPFGNHRDSKMTRVEAYRAGMRALAEGAGEDAVILGCNAPMWPSIGVCNAMRTTGDISRSWPIFKSLAKECFFRNWQNNRLWINDPDCLLLENQKVELMGPDGVMCSKETSSLSEREFSFHKAHILASGGMMLSSDKLPLLREESVRDIEKILSCYGHEAVFEDSALQYGKTVLPNAILHFLFNWEDAGTSEFMLPKHSEDLYDFWTGEKIKETFALRMPSRSARVLLEKVVD